MRRLLLALVAPALLSASAPTDRATQARREAQAAEREVQRLEAAAASASDEADRLRNAQGAAAAAILAAEAKITAAEANEAQLARLLRARQLLLSREQRPAALLLAGLVQMSRRPPLLALADGGSVDEFVRVRALIDTTMPEVRRRSAALAGQVEESRRLAVAARAAREELAKNRKELRSAQQRFAALEREAIARAGTLGEEALAAGDVALSSAERAAELQRNSAGSRSTARMAAALAELDAAPPRPGTTSGQIAAPLAYQLPVSGRVLVGLSEVSPNGVRSRGLRLEASRGAPVLAPADGHIAFAGPFRTREGVVIIDHGGGWMTLLTEVRTTAKVGDRVAKGEPLGRALDDVTVELSRNGRPQPAALIARSSHLLSNGRHSG